MSDVLDQVTQGLVQRGIDPTIAYGITAGVYAENASNTGSLSRLAGSANPTSGAFGLEQLLGSRKQGLLDQYGPNPTFSQQLDYLAGELTGSGGVRKDSGANAVMSSTSPQSALQAYITKFMRPAAGYETNRDLTAGNQYLANNSAKIKGTIGDAIASFSPTLGNASDSLGKALTAPADAIQSVVDKTFGGLNLSSWFQRIALAILAILLIGIALSMLGSKSAQAVLSRSPVPLPG